MLRSFSQERTEMSVCETRRSASYRSVTAVSAALWTVLFITVLRGELDNTSHLSQPWFAQNNARQNPAGYQQNTPVRRRRHPAARSSPTPIPGGAGPLTRAPDFCLRDRSSRDTWGHEHWL